MPMTTARNEDQQQDGPGVPASVDRPEALPQVLVFFVTVADRVRVLRALKAIDTNREAALLKALGVHGDAHAE